MADQPSLPSQGTEAIIQTDPVDAPSPGAPRVVVVDDDPGMRLLLRETLSAAGFNVVVAASGKEAINLCAEFLPDLVLLDINMPVMNGIEACAEIRKSDDRQFPIVMVTSVDDAMSIQRAFQAGASDFILKPVRWPLFQRRLDSILAEWNQSQELDQSNKRVQLLEKVAPEMAIMVSRNGQIIEDLKDRSITGSADPEITNQSLEDLFGADIAQRFKQRISGVLKTGQHKSLEFSHTGQHGSAEYEAQFLVDGRDRVIVVVQHATIDSETRREIYDHAYCDFITNLPNCHFFERYGEEALVDARLHSQSLVFINLCFDDLSRRELANRNLMLAITSRLGDCLADCDGVLQIGSSTDAARVAHIDANQFMFALIDTPGGIDARAAVSRIEQGFASPIESESGSESGSMVLLPVMGVSTFPADGDDLQGLMHAANAAMHEARETGRTVCFNSQAEDTQSIGTLDYGNELRQAMADGQLELYFQPRMSKPDGAITCVEALLRWNHPMRGFVGMSELLHLAKATGLIVPLGDWVLFTACEEARRWQGGAAPRVSVNLSQQEFTRQDLAERVIASLNRTGLEPNQIDLEVTEGALLRAENGRADLESLKELGVGLVLDDFGTGHTSLALLKQYPLDALKIDSSFVRDLPGNAADAAICEIIITIAHKFGMKAVAEGVETQEQLEFLQQRGCDEFQGYHVCRPMPANEIGDYLLQQGKASLK
jgi:EAL domain-containing protein (putative c-di-GMP-specific phosphodiesterase class I)/PleD family two-component response regulator